MSHSLEASQWQTRMSVNDLESKVAKPWTRDKGFASDNSKTKSIFDSKNKPYKPKYSKKEKEVPQTFWQKAWQKTDKTLENLLKPKSEITDAEREKKLNGKASLVEKIRDVVGMGALVAAELSVLPLATVAATGITLSGFLIGSYFDNKKKGQKLTWRKAKREVITGNLIGLLEYAVFSMPEYLMNLSPKFWPTVGAAGATVGNVPKQILRTLLFNPLLVMPYIGLYQGMVYFRDKVGFGRTVGGLVTGQTPKQLKGLYKEKWKKEFWPEAKTVSKYLWPLHFIQLNYLTHPAIRMFQSLLINNPLLRFLVRDKKGEGVKKSKYLSSAYEPKNSLYNKPIMPYGSRKNYFNKQYNKAA